MTKSTHGVIQNIILSTTRLLRRFQILLIATIFLIILSGCGNRPHGKAPILEFTNSKYNDAGVALVNINSNIVTKVKDEALENIIIIELVSDDDYLHGRGSDLYNNNIIYGLIDDSGQAQFRFDSYGTIAPLVKYKTKLLEYRKNLSPGKYWIRAGILLEARNNKFDFLYNLIGRPIDNVTLKLLTKSDGFSLFGVFGMGSFIPFIIEEKSDEKIE